MPAFVVFGISEIRDMDALSAYADRSREILAAHGGRRVAGPLVSKSLEGAELSAGLILEFETEEQALIWYNSPTYRDILPLRQGAAQGFAFVISNSDTTF